MTADAMAINPPLPRQYGDELLVIDHGEGCRLVDRAGKSYLDMGSGIAVNSLGYGRTDLADIAAAQMRRLIHVSNLYANQPALDLAAKMIRAPVPGIGRSRFEAVHFGNSGAEANETALKYARLYAKNRRGEGHHRFIAFSDGFHGRTMGALSVTANPSYREPFEPLIPGVEILPLNDTASLERHLDPTVAAVIVEPVQGEGGLTMVSRDFVRRLNTLCREHDVMLIADEVQTGMGRCGSLFASEITGLEPDLITLAKPLAGGLPLSAVLVPRGINQMLRPGHHATTFGGGPVTTAVASAVWDILSDPAFLAEVRRKGDLLEDLLSGILAGLGVDGEVRGAGLLRGIRLRGENYDGKWCAEVIVRARKEGLIVLKTGADVLRIAPPLVITDDEIAEGAGILKHIIENSLKSSKTAG